MTDRPQPEQEEVSPREHMAGEYGFGPVNNPAPQQEQEGEGRTYDMLLLHLWNFEENQRGIDDRLGAEVLHNAQKAIRTLQAERDNMKEVWRDTCELLKDTEERCGTLRAKNTRLSEALRGLVTQSENVRDWLTRNRLDNTAHHRGLSEAIDRCHDLAALSPDSKEKQP